MAISAKDVMALRKRTGLGMMDCKKALTETNGDTEAAIELLRKKLKGKMEDRSGREASEGLVVVARADDGSAIAMVEMNSETDFCSRSDAFTAATKKISQLVLATDTQGEVQATDEITAIIDELRITVKENINLRRAVRLTGSTLASYVHHTGKLGVVVQVEGELDDESLTGICQHIAAHVPTPRAVDEAALPADEVEKHKNDAINEAKESGKPAEIAEKIATGKLRKWIDENTLLGQKYVKDPAGKQLVKDVVGDAAIKQFIRFAIDT